MKQQADATTGSRREFLSAVGAIALLAQWTDVQASAQQPAEAAPATSQSRPDGTGLLKHNAIFRSSAERMEPSAIGSFQAVVRGTLPTGEGVELHNSTLLPGHEPHPPHQHLHAEFLFLTDGQVDWLLDGVRQAAGPGDVLYAASNVLHGLRNTGTVPAKYFVFAIGPNLRAS